MWIILKLKEGVNSFNLNYHFHANSKAENNPRKETEKKQKIRVTKVNENLVYIFSQHKKIP